MTRALVAGLAAATFLVAANEVTTRDAARDGVDPEARAAVRRRRLPDADLVDPATDGLAAADAALAVRPRDPWLLAAAAAARPDPLDDRALALAVRAAEVGPWAGAVADATAARLLAGGQDLATRGRRLRERATRAAAAGRPDAAGLAAEAEVALQRARAVLDAVVAVDAAIAPSTPGRGPLREKAADARQWLEALEGRP